MTDGSLEDIRSSEVSGNSQLLDERDEAIQNNAAWRSKRMREISTVNSKMICDR
jgi:hypothetical protein